LQGRGGATGIVAFAGMHSLLHWGRIDPGFGAALFVNPPAAVH
jgi:hypothetical protein